MNTVIDSVLRESAALVEAYSIIEQKRTRLKQTVSELETYYLGKFQAQWRAVSRFELYALASFGVDGFGKVRLDIYVYRMKISSSPFHTEKGFFTNTRDDEIFGDVSFQQIEQFIDEFNKEHSPVTASLSLNPARDEQYFVENGLKSEDDCKDFLGDNIEILAGGEIWYKGWDIPDYYFIVNDMDGNTRFFISNSAHGMGATEEEVRNQDEFVEFMRPTKMEERRPEEFNSLQSLINFKAYGDADGTVINERSIS